ncbi:MAG: hypothetical protein ACRDT6_27295 [Micromonosporaceae bacterium]
MRKISFLATAVAVGVATLLSSPAPATAWASSAATAETEVIRIQGNPGSPSTYHLKDCMYYHSQYLGCSYFRNGTEDQFKVWHVCDTFADGRYVKSRLKFNGKVYEMYVAGSGKCVWTAWNFRPGEHIGIHTGVEGIGWTDYEYTYVWG